MKRSIEGDGSDQDDISDIRQKEIWDKWHQQKPLKQIAKETGESVKTVYRILANMQKALNERIGVASYERRKR